MNMAKKDIKRNPAAEKIADLILNNNAEMDAHLGYDKSSSEPKETENRRNGYGEKTIHGSFGETTIAVPRDREGSFKPIAVPKHKKDVSEIEGKVCRTIEKVDHLNDRKLTTLILT